MKKITVILADDHDIVREGLRALLEASNDFEVLGVAANGLEAVEMARTLLPAVVVLDIAMPQLNGIEAARRILHQEHPPKVLILSAHADDAYIQQVATLGVQGYLVKQSAAQILIKAIKEIHKGGTYYGPSLNKRMVDCRDAQDESDACLGKVRKSETRLTSREREVLQLIAEGRANKEAAADLGISIKTVEKHRHNVMRKLGLRDTSGMTRYAISAGIIESSCQSTI